jgi:hypothetical protein
MSKKTLLNHPEELAFALAYLVAMTMALLWVVSSLISNRKK